MRQTIFQALSTKEVCYAVCVSINTFKNKSIDDNSRDYFIVIHEKDCDKLKGRKFYKSGDQDELMERDLDFEEIGIFKDMSDYFLKVKHTSAGRAYEIKGKSFREYYKINKNK